MRYTSISRDMESLVDLFVEDVKPSPGTPIGRDALREHFRRICEPWGFTVHQVCQQAIDFETSDKAVGHVYCRAEHVVGEKFVIAAVRYLDRYERNHGKWYFRWRRSPCWYISDMLEPPTGELRIRWPGQEPVSAPLPGRGRPLRPSMQTCLPAPTSRYRPLHPPTEASRSHQPQTSANRNGPPARVVDDGANKGMPPYFEEGLGGIGR